MGAKTVYVISSQAVANIATFTLSYLLLYLAKVALYAILCAPFLVACRMLVADDPGVILALYAAAVLSCFVIRGAWRGLDL